jgi:short-subunit dehydrogenase
MNRTLMLAAAGVGAWWLYRALSTPSYSFRGKNVLITGGSRGLGLVLARELIDRGASVAICARDEEELNLAFHDLKRHGGRVVAVPCDITVQEQVNSTVEVIESRLGSIDVLINNAGIIGVGPLETMTIDDFERTMRTHFWASLFTTLAVLPGMRQRKDGRIINVSSFGGKVAVPHMVPYVASKFALVGLSSALRAELAGTGVVVTTACPGLMRTGSHLNAEFKGQHDREYAWFALGAAMPLLSISAESAARGILDASARGQAEVVLTIPAKLAVLMQVLMPTLTADLAGLVDRWFLPGPGDGDTTSIPGRDSRGVLPNWVTTQTDRAAAHNNELAAGRFCESPPPVPV